jgi:L-alanine-DL-glutamate epimerase-like enolase superfamily enzyme
MRADSSAAVTAVRARAFRIPTDFPESDGTLEWDSTTLVLVEIEAAGLRGIGYSYADTAAATLVRDKLAGVVTGQDALQTAARHRELQQSVRNIGRTGIAALAISAVDNALWDLKGRLLGQPLVHLLGGAARDRIPAYGSGGFTSYPPERLHSQLGSWAREGLSRVKMKVGRHAAQDPQRVRIARDAIGDDCELFVDANGAYRPKQAVELANRFADESRVTWFEEPVPWHDVDGLAFVRDHGPAGMDITVGEYGFELPHFLHLLRAGAVDVLQADATRCCGLTGFMRVAALAHAFGIPLSSHCAPALHIAACCCAPNAIHVEWFHDHVRIEQMLFDGAPHARAGLLAPDLSRPGTGLDLREADAKEFEL